MKKRDIFPTLEALTSLAEGKVNVKFAYFIAKNKKILEEEAAIIRETLESFKNPEKFEEYESKRIEICKKMSEKDSDGNPVIISNNFVIADADIPEFEKKLEALKNKYSDVIEGQANIKKQIEDLLDEDLEDAKLLKTNLSSFPEEISSGQMEHLLPFICEDDV
jgi:hypothetical protein